MDDGITRLVDVRVDEFGKRHLGRSRFQFVAVFKVIVLEHRPQIVRARRAVSTRRQPFDELTTGRNRAAQTLDKPVLEIFQIYNQRLLEIALVHRVSDHS